MITVRVTRSGDHITAFEVSGHAGYGPDLVCAAVSAVCQAAIIGLKEHLNLRPTVEPRDVENDERGGYLSLRQISSDRPLEPKELPKVDAILETMVAALRDIEKKNAQGKLKIIDPA